jgi:hypothetical protein
MKTIFGILILLLISGGILIGGYTGKIPALTNVLGINDARDLGIDASNVNVDEVHNRLGTELIKNSTIKNLKGVKMEGKKEIKTSLTQEEITALSNNSPYKYNPFKNAQVKINEDGSVEASAILKVETIFQLANSMGYSGEEVRKQMEKYNIPIKDIPVYAKATGYVKNNEVTMNISKAKVGRIPLPSFIIEQATPQVISAAEGLANSFPGFNAKSMTFEKGKMNFEGTIPEKQYFE